MFCHIKNINSYKKRKYKLKKYKATFCMILVHPNHTNTVIEFIVTKTYD